MRSTPLFLNQKKQQKRIFQSEDNSLKILFWFRYVKLNKAA